MRQVSYKEILNEKNYILIDVRTPKEYAAETISGSINIPVLLDNERVEVGTAYKQVSKEKAKELGIEFISKRLPGIFQEINNLNKKYKKLVFLCARGGMRSSSMTALFSSLGYKCSKLTDGYKGYRKFISEDLSRTNSGIKYIVLHGRTGVGKTKILQQLETKGYSVLDLEKYADHKGSIFGAIGEKRKQSQKRFESLIYEHLRENQHNYVLVESESKRIGDVYLPDTISDSMKDGLHLFLDTSLDHRVKILMEDYADASEEDILNCVNFLKKYIGKEKTESYSELTKSRNYAQLAAELVVDYYDPLYEKSIKKWEYESIINYESVDEGVQGVINFLDTMDFS
ncbi:tRNA 2-selenouridine(34) synthase MnmH [uncultured Ilyobacter sp.]|uniref:tRNA 2-selenouridine(34) synthase MnmH n=1 Tax=uncultured Ilyobacter sp. TaxID=544433 RepID=UPI0029F5BB37|nr:tRNA 2-selenouridine(34) synthase MnmH [uncultured Ilyobacter sp.]